MADRIITVTSPSIVTNDTLIGYNNYTNQPSPDTSLGAMMTPTEATNGHPVTLTDGLVHEVTTKPVGATNGEFTGVVSAPVTVDLSSSEITPTFTLTNLTKVDAQNEYFITDGSSDWLTNYGIGIEPISGDFEFTIDMSADSAATYNPTGTFAGVGRTNTSENSNDATWEIGWRNNLGAVSPRLNGVSGTLDVPTTVTYVVGDKLVIKRVGSTFTLVFRNIADGDTTIHTYGTPSGGALTQDIYPRIGDGKNRIIVNPLILK